MFSSTFTTTKYRRTRSPLQLVPLYDITQPMILDSYHASHIQMTEAEVANLWERAVANMRRGTTFIPPDLCVESLRNFHCV